MSKLADVGNPKDRNPVGDEAIYHKVLSIPVEVVKGGVVETP